MVCYSGVCCPLGLRARQCRCGLGEEREGRGWGEEVERGGGGGGGSGTTLLVTAKKLHSQGDALVPLPRQDADEAGVERRLEDILFVNVVVAVAGEDLSRRERRHLDEEKHLILDFLIFLSLRLHL